MKKRLINFVILIIGLGLIVNLSRDIWHLLKAGDQVKLAQQGLEEAEREHQELLEKKKYYQSEEFVEEEARNKLNMARPEEAVMILPPNVGELVGRVEAKEPEVIPNWQQWFKLFF